MRTGRRVGRIPLTCWVCTGKNTRGKHHPCRLHFSQAKDRAAKFNISQDEAVAQMREELTGDEEMAEYEQHMAEQQERHNNQLDAQEEERSAS